MEPCHSEPRKKMSIQVEIRMKKNVPKSSLTNEWSSVENYAKKMFESALNWKPIAIPILEDSSSEIEDEDKFPIASQFEQILFGSCEWEDGAMFSGSDLEFSPTRSNIHIYKLNSDGPLAQNIGDDEENIVGSQHWQLPCVEFQDIWENLIYDSNLKNELMSYVSALVYLSEKHVNSKIISVNRLILLTGPPGTGKTSLCKGLAQHLSIRLNDRYTHSVLVEINSHSLFSKWFSESGKLVQRMFDQIDEIAEDSKTMVFVLIDEVESLGMCREGSSSKSEPADAIRAVNALLTQIDRIRRRENVLILCTSNLEKTLDPALVDRADIVKNVGPPSPYALYSMLKSCIMELVRDPSTFSKPNQELFEIAEEAVGLSGRAISMLPVLAYSKWSEEQMTIGDCYELLRKAVKERKSRL